MKNGDLKPLTRTDSGVSISVAERADAELVEAFALLIPQLSQSSAPPTEAALQAIVDAEASHILIARDETDNNRIIGSTTLVIFTIPTGTQGRIEDVVVDTSTRGRGVGAALNIAALELAKRHGAKSVGLTSRPSREAANRLYRRLGFKQRETNVYSYKIEQPT